MLWSIGVVFVAIFALGSCLQCLDENFKTVDWWICLKPPTSISDDYKLFCMTSNDKLNGFKSYNIVITDPLTPISNTFDQVNLMASGFKKLFAWNDETPTQTSSTSAHSKGVLAFDDFSSNGFFMQFSLPKFPMILEDLKINYTLSSDSKSTLDKIGGNIMLTTPFKNGYNFVPPSLSSTNGAQYGIHPDSNVLEFTTSGSKPQKLVMVSKKNVESIDMYNQVVSPLFQTGIEVESWGRPYEDDFCKPKYEFDQINILYLRLNGGQNEWKDTQDHSKWLVSSPSYALSLYCGGDINRMTSQAIRGGTSLCIEDSSVHNAFLNIITSVQKC